MTFDILVGLILCLPVSVSNKVTVCITVFTTALLLHTGSAGLHSAWNYMREPGKQIIPILKLHTSVVVKTKAFGAEAKTRPRLYTSKKNYNQIKKIIFFFFFLIQ